MRRRSQPAGLEGFALGVAGGGLDADDGALVELLEVGGPDVRAGAADAGDDRVEQVLDARAFRVEVHPSGRDSLAEEALPSPLEGRVVGRPRPDRTRGRHPEALLVDPTVAVAMRIPGRLVRPREPRPDHPARRSRGQGQRHVPRMPYAAVRPHMLAKLARPFSTLQYGG